MVRTHTPGTHKPEPPLVGHWTLGGSSTNLGSRCRRRLAAAVSERCAESARSQCWRYGHPSWRARSCLRMEDLVAQFPIFAQVRNKCHVSKTRRRHKLSSLRVRKTEFPQTAAKNCIICSCERFSSSVYFAVCRTCTLHTCIRTYIVHTYVRTWVNLQSRSINNY